MLKQTLSLSIVAAFLTNPMSSYALDPAKDCTKEILYSFFPEVFVNAALEKNNIPKEKWAKINSDLKEKDQGIIKTFEARLSQLPESERLNRENKMQNFKNTLKDTFTEVLKSNGIEDEKLILKILDDINQPRAKRFQECVHYHGQQAMENNDDSSEEEDDNFRQ